jgi:hypothetical protein
MFEKKKKNNQNIIVHPLWIMVEQIKKNIEKHKFKKNKFEQVKKNTNWSCIFSAVYIIVNPLWIINQRKIFWFNQLTKILL